MKAFKHEFLVVPLDVECNEMLGVDILKRMEERVDLRTSTFVLERSTFVLERSTHRLSGQEVERCTLINLQKQAVKEWLGMGLITPEKTGPKNSVGKPIAGLRPGETDIRVWDVVASGPAVFPPLS